MSKKRRVKLVLNEDEAAVVAPLEFWNHLRMIYEAYAEHATEAALRDEWLWASDLIRYWMEETRAQDDDENF